LIWSVEWVEISAESYPLPAVLGLQALKVVRWHTIVTIWQ
jgi:hypothetical protein